MASVILSIEQGTTGTTALLGDRRARIISSGYAELPQHYPRPGWVEHDPQEMLSTTRLAIQRALAHARLRARAVAAIGITNQRETTLVWDRRTGRAVARAIVWQCRRTAPLCDQLSSQGYAPEFRRKTSLVLGAHFFRPEIRWLLDHVPGLRARAQLGAVA